MNWNNGFRAWMTMRGYKERSTASYSLADRYDLPRQTISLLVEEYNRSAAVAYLFPMPGASLIIGKLRELGYTDIHCITSFGGDTFSQLQRQRMLWDYFRIEPSKVHFLPLDGQKRDLLSRWEGTGVPWIEDKVENAIDGHVLGLDPILLRSDHTRDYISDKVFVAESWYEIFEHITGEERCRTSGSLSI